jgi:acyl-CoA thioester hydrolase
MTLDPRDTFTLTFRVRYEECGPGGTVHAAAYMRYLQDLAFAHSAALGYPLAWYEAQRLFWLVRRVRLAVHAPARYGDDLRATTVVTGMRRVMARRRNAIRTADGALVASAIVDWIFTSGGVAPTRVPEAFTRTFPALTRTIAPAPLPAAPAPAGAVWSPLRIRVGDTDAMGHANNAVYIDLLDDAVVRAGGAAAVAAHPRTYEAQYGAAAAAGAPLRDVAWRDGTAWRYRLESMAGRLHLHGDLTPAADPAGGFGDIP